MKHIIKKQVIDLSLERGLDAFRIQQQVSNYYFDKIVPLLQEAFDSASREDETISIDNLEIDLGIINEREIEKGTWEETVFKNISEQLIPVKHQLPSGIKVKKKSRSLSISDQWIFYMQHGYLPWNILEINEQWYNKTLEAFASDASAIHNLRNLIKSSPGSIKRIVFQNSDHFLKSLVETLTAENQEKLPLLIDGIVEIISPAKKNNKGFTLIQKKEAKQKLWEQVLELASSSNTKLKSSEFVGLLLNKEISVNHLNIKKVKKFLLKNKLNDTLSDQNIKEKEPAEPDNVTEKFPDKDVIKKERKIEMNEDGVYVSNAGIVLLHPFLHPFFKNLHLVQEGDFTDAQSQLKALYLLHYMSSGNTKPQEHVLVIAKIMCAFPLEHPVENLVELTEEELLESDSVLESAIGQWEILKSTSIDGLREGFLQRNGKLFAKNGNLHLQIEANSIDMLLDHLPWNLSIIKLPWMKDILKVEWR